MPNDHGKLDLVFFHFGKGWKKDGNVDLENFKATKMDQVLFRTESQKIFWVHKKDISWLKFIDFLCNLAILVFSIKTYEKSKICESQVQQATILVTHWTTDISRRRAVRTRQSHVHAYPHFIYAMSMLMLIFLLLRPLTSILMITQMLTLMPTSTLTLTGRQEASGGVLGASGGVRGASRGVFASLRAKCRRRVEGDAPFFQDIPREIAIFGFLGTCSETFDWWLCIKA